MDPITHGIVGLAIAAFTGETAALTNPYAIGSLLGAVIPDGDIIMQIKGHYSYLKSHRGASHSVPFSFLYAGAITLLLSLLYPGVSLLKLFMYAFFGCISHIILDITNSYGAKVLWPFIRKRLTIDLLLVYDPLLIIFSLAIIVPTFRALMHPVVTIVLFASYLLFRSRMKMRVKKIIKENLDNEGEIVSIRILPSMIGLLKWHFVLKLRNKKIVGEVNILPRDFKIIDIMENLDNRLYNAVKNTKVAKFFGEFTPIFHINCKKLAYGYEFSFTDLRYYMAKDFLHHATAVLDENFSLVSSLFHPYNKSRNVEI